MDKITKLQPIFIIISAIIGLILGYAASFGDISVYFIKPFLIILLYFVFLSVDGEEFKKGFLNVKFTVIAFIINFVWTPMFAYALGKIFFNNNIDMQVGLMMLLVTPCTNWYLVFTAFTNGNIDLGASILPLNLLLQILLMPIYIFIFYRGSIEVNFSSLILNILLVLVLPFVLSLISKILEKRNEKIESILEKFRYWTDKAQLIFLCLAVFCMFAAESRSLFDHPLMLLKMLLPMILFYIINFVLVRFIGPQFGFKEEDIIPLNFTTLARNSPVALAIAIIAFPDHPLILLALVVGPLIEIPALFIISFIINKLRQKNLEETDKYEGELPELKLDESGLDEVKIDVNNILI